MMSTIAVMDPPFWRLLPDRQYPCHAPRSGRSWKIFKLERCGKDATMAKGLHHLGKLSRLPANPDEAVLDRVANPHPDTNYVARFTAPEFTTMCPVTGQPD